MREKIAVALNETIVAEQPVGGGCIADSRLLRTASGRKLFMKTYSGNAEMCLAEAGGLRALTATKTLYIPEVLFVDASCLVLEYIESGAPTASFFTCFGHAFAALHKHENGRDTYGFSENNFLGNTPQINTPAADWATFFWENRLLYQLRLAEKKRLANADLSAAFARLETKFYDLLAGSEEPPTLLHGDLWSGNFMVTAASEPCLIDPAAYYGHREADLAMTKLFGGFSNAFYLAYEETYPLAAGHERRLGLYKLYHIMNHLNLFGGSYAGQASSLLHEYVD